MNNSKSHERKIKLEHIIFSEYLVDMKTSKVFYEYSNRKKSIILNFMIKNDIETEINWCVDTSYLENIAYQLYLEDNNYKHVYTQYGMITLKHNKELNFEKYFKIAMKSIRKEKITHIHNYD